MRYWKKQFTMSLVIILILSLALGSFVMAEGQIGGGQSSGGGATTPVPTNENSCQSYSNDRNNVIANHSNIVVNGDGTATATFKTKIDCVRVSFSSYVAPPDWAPGPGDMTIPYNKQTYYDGKSLAFDKAGTYTITITIPKCLPYQLDIYSGDLLKVLGTGAHGDKILAWNLKLQNSCTGNIVINKLINNIEGAPHAGITFELWKNNQLFKSGVTGSDGTLQFNNLPIGNYVLKELTLDGFTTDLTVNEQIAVTTDSTQLKVVINTPKLKIESACSANPDETRNWKVTNESNIDVPYSWEVIGSSQSGTGSLPAKASAAFSTGTVTNSAPMANTLKLNWSVSKELLFASTGELCVTPTPSATPTPTPTVTPTASPTPDVTPTVTPTASPTPDVTPTLPPTASPTPDVTPTVTPTASPTPDVTPTVTPTASPTPDVTPTVTPTASPTPDVTPTVPPSTSPTPETTPTTPPSTSPTPETTPTTPPSSAPTPVTTPQNTPYSTPSTTPTPVSTPTSTPVVSTAPTPTSSPEVTTIVEIVDEEPPIGGIDNNENGEPPIDTVIDVAEDQVPLDTLPKTGDSSPIPYYLIGAFALSAGFLSLRKKRQGR